MDINSKNKKLCLEPLRGIVTQGEKLADTVTFRLPNVYGNLTLSALSWQLRAASEKNTLATADLTASASGEFCLVQWEVSADFTAVSGALSLMLVGTDAAGNTVIKFPGDSPIWVRDSETGAYSPPEDAIENALNGLQQAEQALQDAITTLKEIGISLDVRGWYDTLEALQSAVPTPEIGWVYGVGDPTVLYVYNGVEWVSLPGVSSTPPLPLSIANGGTGGTTVTQALANLGAQASNNLLVNPRFKYNSRDQQSYSTTGNGFTVDGWMLQGNQNQATVAVSANGIVFTQSAGSQGVYQLLKEPLEVGKTYTISVVVNGVVYSATQKWEGTGVYPLYPGQGFNFGFDTSGGQYRAWVYLDYRTQSSSVTITAAKLELGSASTLQAELDNPPPEDVEKLKLDMYDLDPGRCAYLPWHNENLLDNWYFVGGGSQQGGGQFPINQRGQTSYTAGDYQYCIDRWLQDGENVTIVDNGVKIEAQDTTDLDNKIFQNIESIPHNIPLTFSAIIDNKLYIVQGMSLTRIQNIVSDFIGVEIGESNGYQYALIRNTQGSITIQAVKLERGFLSTLASKNESGNWVLNDAPPNFQQELAKCQRYQITLDGTTVIAGRTYVGVETSVLCFSPTPVTMRINPTWVGDIENITVYSNGKTYTATSIINVNKATNGISFTVKISSGVGVKQPIIASLQPGGIFDANL